MSHQLCSLEHRQMLRDGRLRDTREMGQCVNGLFALSRQFFEDGSSGRVGERTEHEVGGSGLHEETITKWLWFVKQKFHALAMGIPSMKLGLVQS
jgi:hypothetical protein